ncbi:MULTISPECIES: DUF4007 family protein [unclassified Exiguobacterium]|jgi:hypothetical protein|uniref:DUF4007 family protein n=1 Tax=unclassified Exiguobacterium TaxID=2644629 RepID=UPI001BEA7B92|nr:MULTISPECIES: DUF4007 family protein [unclassified Exiguobacterium]
MGFGQHQSFYFRPSWINKGLEHIGQNSRFFYEKNHFEILGLGKNMAKSLRYWLIATNVVEEQKGKQTVHTFTDFGQIIYKYDRHLQHGLSLGMLHYYLVTNKDMATSWYWFFNEYRESVFDRERLITALEKWIEVSGLKAVSPNTLKRDIDCLLNMYALKDYKSLTPEDVISCPLENLEMISKNVSNYYTKSFADVDEIRDILFVSLLVYSEKHGQNEFAVEELAESPELWGKVFNLSRSAIVEYATQMTEGYPIRFIRTNKLDTILLTKEITSIEALKEKFEQYSKEVSSYA